MGFVFLGIGVMLWISWRGNRTEDTDSFRIDAQEQPHLEQRQWKWIEEIFYYIED
jgi:hypothetical protein